MSSDDTVTRTLDRLAGLADHVPVADRLPLVRQRARAARRRRAAGVAVAAVAAAGIALGAVQQWEPRADAPPATQPGPSDAAPATQSAEASPVGPTPGTTQRVSADVDGDGRPDRVILVVPHDPSEDVLLEATWSSGGAAGTAIPQSMTMTLDKPLDLDRDGDDEVVVSGGGGEVAQWWLFTRDQAGNLMAVDPVDADGNRTELVSDSATEAWQVTVQHDGVWSYRLVDPEGAASVGPEGALEVVARRWKLAGTVLEESDASLPRCFTPSVGTVGPC